MNSFIYFLPIFLFCDLVFSESLQTDNGCVSSAESLQDASVLPKSSLNINLPDAMNYHHNEYENFGNKSYSKNEAAVYALMSACMVGLSGIAPLVILPAFEQNELEEEKNKRKLKRLLSFAVGGLLGDVFLHLLPESWEHLKKTAQDEFSMHWGATVNGLWILVGLISFCLLEKLFPENLFEMEDENSHRIKSDAQSMKFKLNEKNNNEVVRNGLNGTKQSLCERTNGDCSKLSFPKEKQAETHPKIKTSGYLNLLANCIDNFTHGLAVGGSYLVSTRVGILTTIAILLHEIPHEVGDFAILLRAGFKRWQAVKLQLLTASGGVIGAATVFLAESAGDRVSWILPFTSGGFIYVALCTVVPDILKETSPRESVIQLAHLLFAILIMYAVGFVE